MKNRLTPAVIPALLVFLFLYTGIEKLTAHRQLVTNLSAAPLLRPFAGILSLALPVIEMATAALLLFSKTRRAGYLIAIVLLSLFTVYLGVMLVTKQALPCSCGGIISSLTWPQHMILNLVCMALAFIAFKTEQNLYCNKQGLAENL